jgi:hypothetical protein
VAAHRTRRNRPFCFVGAPAVSHVRGIKIPLHPLVLCPVLVLAGASAPDCTLTGSLPAADSGERRFELTLLGDGSALLRTEYPAKGRVEERGRWERSGSLLELNLAGEASPVVWRRHGRSLEPVSWDCGEWGTGGPPILTDAAGR